MSPDTVRYEVGPHLVVEADGPVRIVRLDRPEQLNATNHELHKGLAALFPQVDADADARAVVLTGNGRAFSAGGDFAYLDELARDSALRRETLAHGRQIVTGMVGCRVPVIAAVNGPAVGLGCSLVALSDIVFMAESAHLAADPCTIEAAELVQSAEDHHQPIVLAPEDAATDRLHTAVGGLADAHGSPVPAALGTFVTSCFRELSNLDKESSCPGGKKYLSRIPALTEIKRLFLCGHSGGGQPLSPSCRADVVKNTPTDLGLLDCTYGWGNVEYVQYCSDKKASKKLGNAKGQSRLLDFYTFFPETEDAFVKMRTH